MGAKPTPGPWRLDYPDGWGGAFVETTQPVDDGRTALICSLYDRQSAFPPDDDEKESNGRLIAAAPELLEALQGWMRHLDGEPGGPTDTPEYEDALMTKMRAAIAAATGEKA